MKLLRWMQVQIQMDLIWVYIILLLGLIKITGLDSSRIFQ
jgi:hypothetical protein